METVAKGKWENSCVMKIQPRLQVSQLERENQGIKPHQGGVILQSERMANIHQTGMIKSNPLQLYSGSEKQIQGIRSDRVPDELWMEVRDTVQETGIKTIPMEKKCKKAKWLSEESSSWKLKQVEVSQVEARAPQL